MTHEPTPEATQLVVTDKMVRSLMDAFFGPTWEAMPALPKADTVARVKNALTATLPHARTVPDVRREVIEGLIDLAGREHERRMVDSLRDPAEYISNASRVRDWLSQELEGGE